MSTINTEVFGKFKLMKKLPAGQEDGHGIQVEEREDEEQLIKLQEIIDLLVAAGYFRARIKGLSSFDKVVGGMIWCIESCNVDINVDLLFQENLTIGQKIVLTENIVLVLPKMKCPHAIEPHQIQGLDFIHIFPVIQWMVKRSMEFRQEMFEFVRSYTVNQYSKQFGINKQHAEVEATILKNVSTIYKVYRPRRYYKKIDAGPSDINSRIQVTLLEFGHDGINLGTSNSNTLSENEENKKENDLQKRQISENLFDYNELNEEEREHLVKHYESLHLEIKDRAFKSTQGKQLFTMEALNKDLIDRCVTLEIEYNKHAENKKMIVQHINEIKHNKKEASKKFNDLQQTTANDKTKVVKVEELVILNDTIRSQEAQFREYCKKELTRLKDIIKEIKQVKTPNDNNEENNIKHQIGEKIKELRDQLAKKNRIVAGLLRGIDDVPNRLELAQYQTRFLELYNQVSLKHKETKQYYNRYNTLEDSRMYMKRELSLLNSICDCYPEALMSIGGKDEFLEQLRAILDGVKESKQKTHRKLSEEKQKRDQLSGTLQLLVENQRKYVAAVRLLSIECKKHESLLSTQI